MCSSFHMIASNCSEEGGGFANQTRVDCWRVDGVISGGNLGFIRIGDNGPGVEESLSLW